MPSDSPQANISSGLRDNHSRGKAGDFLRESIVPGADLSFVSAYFTVHAYQALRDELESAGKLRFLFGEPSFIRSIEKEGKQSRQFKLGDHGLSVANQLSQKKLAKDCAQWISRMVEIKSIVRAGFLHGKMYHIQDGKVAQALLGSSNFTVPGLGLQPSGNNIELNLIVSDDRDRMDLLEWFNGLWGDDGLTTDVKEQVLKELARLYSNQTPEFIYYLTLFHLFRHYLDNADDLDKALSRTALPDTGIWNALFSFQKDGAKAAINKILANNGCILADSVGLGKTYTALAVIKFFELRNERVLVLCPKKLRRNWTVYKSNSTLNPFDKDRFGYHVLSHTDLGRESGEVDGHDLSNFNWGAYDLVVIDESHNFRNNKQAVQRPGEPERRSRYQRLMEDIVRKGQKTKVLLLSATPVNNQLADLRNQISIIAGGDVSRDAEADAAFSRNLEIPSIKETTRIAQGHFTAWSKKKPDERTSRDLLQGIGGDFFKLLDGLSIARSRRQIATYYKDEMKRLGGFPKRPAPIAIHPTIDLADKFLSFEKLDEEIGKLRLALYHPTSFIREDLPDEIKATYEEKILGVFTQKKREEILVAMMKVNFLKRLESSVDSFRLTLHRTIEKINVLEQRIDAFELHVENHPEIDWDNLAPDENEDPDEETRDFTIGGRRRIHLAHLKLEEWLQAVRHDRTQLQFLYEKTEKVRPERDAKLSELRSRIQEKVVSPSTNQDGKSIRKVLVFTAFADTAKYLYQQLSPWARENLGIHTALVCGDGENKTSLSNSDFDDILTNFSPVSKRRADQPRFPQDEEIDLLIATDCISEGQNLQDCDLLINYDIHWNPVRIIQRFGRIDRIGSRNAAVQLVNFWPVADLDRYLNVKHRVEARMALADLAATMTDNLLNPDQIEDLISEDLRFRNKQLKRLKDEVLDLEDFTDSPSLTDFSLDEFRIDLLQFLESRRKELESAPPGLYAVVSPDLEKFPAARPGVLFCLKRAGDGVAKSTTSENLNPLAPHFLVYVLDDGTVRLSFVQPKDSLLLLRGLAAGQSSAMEKLCDIFDARSKDGTDMSHYDGLARSALRSIEATFQKRAAAALLSSRSGLLPTMAETPQADTGDWELVTWLVVMEAKQEST
jgi:SNF2 family DNA or RNA helicase